MSAIEPCLPVAPRSMRDIELVMESYLQDYHPANLIKPSALDIDQFLDFSLNESHGFMLDIVPRFPNSDIEALMLVGEKKIQIPERCWIQLERGHMRSRFSVCHEGAHVILHSAQYEMMLINPARRVKRVCKTFENPEWQAEHGAGALLMPLRTFVPFVYSFKRNRFQDVQITTAITEVYKVTHDAAKSRMRQIEKPQLSTLVAKYKTSQNVVLI